jgi:hypothetical protein
MKFAEPTKLHRKSEIWGTPRGTPYNTVLTGEGVRTCRERALTLLQPTPIITFGPVIISVRVSHRISCPTRQSCKRRPDSTE